MTPVPVVSATLTTRTVRECRFDALDEWGPDCGAPPNPFRPHEVRERLTVDPVFVVLSEARDLIAPDQFDLLYGPWAAVIDPDPKEKP